MQRQKGQTKQSALFALIVSHINTGLDVMADIFRIA